MLNLLNRDYWRIREHQDGWIVWSLNSTYASLPYESKWEAKKIRRWYNLIKLRHGDTDHACR